MPHVRLAKSSTLHIPSITIFGVISREEYYKKYIQDRGIDSVVLPLIELSGFYFPYKIDDQTRAAKTIDEEGGPGQQMIELADAAIFFRSKGLSIYFSLALAMPELSLDSGACDVLDQVGSHAAHCCINNPLTQNYISLLLGESLSRFRDLLGDSIKGIALDSTELWPMSARTGRFLLTCFCSHCVESLRKLSHNNLNPDWFRGFPNGINLALAETIAMDEQGEEEGGIVPVNGIKRDMEPDDLLDACSQVRGTQPAIAYDKGTFEAQRMQFRRWAKQLMLYLNAKADLTANVCRQIFSHCRQILPNVPRIIISEAEQYNWTSGLFLSQLNIDLADEIWLPITSLHVDSNTRLRPLLARRACYHVNTFFGRVNMTTNPRLRATLLQRMPAKRMRRRLAHIADMATAEIQREGDAILPEFMANRPEAVAIGLDPEIITRLMNHIANKQGWEDM